MAKLTEVTFQELCADVFDEVDRRELETIWVASVRVSLIQSHFLKVFLENDDKKSRYDFCIVIRG